MNQPLFEKWRPHEWSEVVGQDKALKKVETLRQRGLGGRAILLTGESGTGKTTIARLIAQEIAKPFAIVELDAQRVTLEMLRELDRSCHGRPLGGGYHCFIINECHGLNTRVVSELQTILESPHVQRTSTWIFTTTTKGQKHLFDTKFDAVPFLSRAVPIELDWRGSELDFAIRARDIAQKEGLDGRGIDEYLKLATEHKCNLRSMLNAIDAGELLEA
jgi:replication-associated recombination protein RarA